jgi:GDP-L-fucose synthase
VVIDRQEQQLSDPANFWRGKKVLVTGGGGFLGSHLVERLRQLQAVIESPSHAEYDLVDRDQIIKMYSDYPSEMVIHLAAVVGGIGVNQKHPGKFFYDNLMMGVQLMEYARLAKIPKFVALGTICAYPKHTPIPFKEEDLWIGYPEETNAPYGLAKKMMLVQSQAYRQEYGYNSIFLLPVNLYGPRDNFDPESSHVIPALIKKCLDAKELGEDHIEVWGDGSPTREFLFVEDAVDGILLAAEKYNKSDPVNLGSSAEITIKELAKQISKATGFAGEIKWDISKPNGQPRRKLDTAKAKKEFGFEAKVSFEKGLKETVKWYLKSPSSIKTR